MSAMSAVPRPRLNIYVHTPRLPERVRLAAARRGTSVSAYCEEAIQRQLVADGLLPGDAHAAAGALDRLRERRGPLGVSVAELIADGRRR